MKNEIVEMFKTKKGEFQLEKFFTNETSSDDDEEIDGES